MDRVVELLDPTASSFSYRQALVRLWVIASDDQVLNRWEQANNEASSVASHAAFLGQLQDERAIGIDESQAHPLALIRALDDYLASTRLPSSQTTSAGAPDFQFTEDGRAYWLVPVTLEARRSAAMDQQPVRLARWFRHHAVLPGRTPSNIEVVCFSARSALAGQLAALAVSREGVLKVWIAHFDDGADVVGQTHSSPIGNWRAQAVSPHEVRRASLTRTLLAADVAGAQVVVFPEFTLDLEHRQWLASYLRKNRTGIHLVVAGAFHAEDKTANPPGTYNTAPVYTNDGRHLFSHRKLRLFGNRVQGAEHAEVGNSVQVLVTPIGCMTVLICKDFLDQDPRVDNLLAEVPVDWVWVPSFGDEKTLRAHKARAKGLSMLATGTSSVVAQTQSTVMKAAGVTQQPLPGFGHPGGEQSPTDVGLAGGLVEFSLKIQIRPERQKRASLKVVKRRPDERTERDLPDRP